MRSRSGKRCVCVYNPPLCEEGLGGFWVTCSKVEEGGQVGVHPADLWVVPLQHLVTKKTPKLPRNSPPTSTTPSCQERIQVRSLPLSSYEFIVLQLPRHTGCNYKRVLPHIHLGEMNVFTVHQKASHCF